MTVTSIGGRTGNISAVEIDGKSATVADLVKALEELGLVIDTSTAPETADEPTSESAPDYNPDEE